MSQYHPNFDPPKPATSGLAITAIVLACLGLCVPLLGIVGLILGIVAVTKASASPQSEGGKGLGIAAIVVGGSTTVLSCLLSVGILLPALGKARESARQLKSSVQVRQIGMGLHQYAVDNKDWLPEAGADLPTRLSIYGVPNNVFITPRGEGQATAADSYIYIPGFQLTGIRDPANTIIIYENPQYVPRGVINVLYADGHVSVVPAQQLQQALDASPKPQPPAPAPKPKPGR